MRIFCKVVKMSGSRVLLSYLTRVWSRSKPTQFRSDRVFSKEVCSTVRAAVVLCGSDIVRKTNDDGVSQFSTISRKDQLDNHQNQTTTRHLTRQHSYRAPQKEVPGTRYRYGSGTCTEPEYQVPVPGKPKEKRNIRYYMYVCTTIK